MFHLDVRKALIGHFKTFLYRPLGEAREVFFPTRHTQT